MVVGCLFAMLASCTFGLIPLLAIPLMGEDISISSILFYRFFTSAIVIAGLLVVRGLPLLVCWHDLNRLALLGFFYSMSCITFFIALQHMESGIVATVQFCYPVFVVMFMAFFFKEKVKPSTMLAIVLAIAGVGVFSLQNGVAGINAIGLGVTILCATQTALYVTGIQALRLRETNGLTMTFYLMFFGCINSFIYAMCDGSFVVPTSPSVWTTLLVLGGVTGVISNLSLVAAVKRAGPTLTAVLGACEPLTALVVGVLVFQEAFGLSTVVGATLILAAVAIVMLAPHLHRKSLQRMVRHASV